MMRSLPLNTTQSLARQTIRDTLSSFYTCPKCERVLSVGEQIERFCECCKTSIRPVMTRGKAA